MLAGAKATDFMAIIRGAEAHAPSVRQRERRWKLALLEDSGFCTAHRIRGIFRNEENLTPHVCPLLRAACSCFNSADYATRICTIDRGGWGAIADPAGACELHVSQLFTRPDDHVDEAAEH